MKGPNRRNFVKGTVGASLVLAGCKVRQDGVAGSAVKADGPAAAVRVRKDLHTLTATSSDIVSYLAAVRAMRAREGAQTTWTTASPRNSRGILPASAITGNPWATCPADGTSWIRQAMIHHARCPHGRVDFLPWHRVYLVFFEDLIKMYSGDENFALPYWDWTKNPALPDFMRAGDAIHPGRESHVVSDDSTKIDNMRRVMNSVAFTTFSSGIEGPHGMVHVDTGGEMGAFMSPLDPIFWMHHANVDRVWEAWRAQPGRNNGGMDTTMVQDGFFNRTGAAASKTTAQVLNLNDAGYRYDRLTVVAPSGSPLMLTGRKKGLGLDDGDGAAPTYSFTDLTGSDEEFTVDLSSDFQTIVARVVEPNDGFGPQTAIALTDDTGQDDTVLCEIDNIPVPSDTKSSVRVSLKVADGTPVYLGTLSFFNASRGGSADLAKTQAFDIKLALKENLPAGATSAKIILRSVDANGQETGKPDGATVKLGYAR